MRIQHGPPFIIDCLSPGGSLQGGVFRKCSNIYKPPQNKCPRSVDSNQRLPLMGTPRYWLVYTCVIPDLGLGVGGWGLDVQVVSL